MSTTIRRAIAVLGVIFVVVILALMCIPAKVSGGPSKAHRIFSNLRAIAVAKQLWADDHKAAATEQLTERDLIPYLPGSNFVSAIASERYVINPLGVSPEAQLSQDLGSLRKGTVFRFDPQTIIPPNTKSEGNRQSKF